MKLILHFSILLILFSGCTSNAEEDHTHDHPHTTPDKEMTSPSKQLRHVVLFKFKETASAEDIAKVEKAFAALPEKISEIKGFEWGLNNSPEGLDKGFTHCFILTFDTEAGRATYLPHPDHKAFGAMLGPILEDVLVHDFWTGE